MRTANGIRRAAAMLLLSMMCVPSARADAPLVRPALALVPASDAQPGGPTHGFRIGVREITNNQYAAFLNDALGDATGTPSERSAFLYFDTASGDVYLHNAAIPLFGSGAGGHTVFVFAPGVAGRITFTNGAYEVTSPKGGVDYADHPVVGVSWYGAVKFCNWLTLHHGMNAAQRAYAEGPGVADWHPIVTSPGDWAVRDLDDAERLALATQVRGYRLPMDDGANNAPATSDAPDLFNEWHKAAAWSAPATGAGVNYLYGFGRQTIAGADANFLSSMDPFAASGTTPAGWFDGVNQLSGGAVTRNTANPYGLYDLCGNVGEWVQDHGAMPARRAIRGGHWQNSGSSTFLDNNHRDSDLATSVRTYVGFRIAQSAFGDPVGIAAACGGTGACASAVGGPIGGPYAPQTFAWTVTAPPDAPADYEACSEVDWLTLDGDECVTGFLLPGQEGVVHATLHAASADTVIPARPAAIEMRFISALDVQPDGPTYWYRLSVYETTNEEFAAFLNDARANPANERGAYLYFDTAGGDVYVNSAAAGACGTGSGGRTLKLFAPAAGGRISFDPVAARYVVTSGFARHPVSGVSWLGAVKYCNWLTVSSGVTAAQRAYTEGPHAGDWHPVTIPTADWWGTTDTAAHPAPQPGARDLSAAERIALLDGYKGYRLPMDGGVATASPHNEWYKAAAWTGSGHAVYGFGADTLAPSAANVSGNGDPFEPGATPVGFFDGTVYNAGVGETVGDGGEFATTADENRYALRDLCGNVAEWIQDAGSDTAWHGLGGGSYLDDEAAPRLRTDGRDTLPAGETRADVGFRVAQSGLDHVGVVTFHDLSVGADVAREVRLLVTEPLTVAPRDNVSISGFFGGPFGGDDVVYTLASDSARPMSWLATRDRTWISLNGAVSASGQLTQTVAAAVQVSTNAGAMTLPPGTHTATVTFRNQSTGYVETRGVTLVLAEPMQVACASGGAPCPPAGLELLPSPVWNPGIPGATPTYGWTYEIRNIGGVAFNYSATSSANWIAFGPGQASGAVAAGGARTIAATTTANLAALGVGAHVATLTFRNVPANTTTTRTVAVTVLDPLEVVESAAAEWSGPPGGPFTPDAPASAACTVRNRADYVVDFNVVSDTAWLTVNGSASYASALPPRGEESVVLDIGPAAADLAGGVYTSTLTFTDLASGVTQTRQVHLTIAQGLSVEPAAGFASSGRDGGPYAPLAAQWTLSNPGPPGAEAIHWSIEVASADPPDTGWLRTIGGPPAGVGGTLDPGESAALLIFVDPGVMGPGRYTATLRFVNDGPGGGAAPQRSVALTIVDPIILDLDERLVPADAPEPGGPAHSFLIQRYDVTNAHFVRFLNDARAHLADERGAYVYFDDSSGDVFINTAAAGAAAAGPSGRTTKLFAPSTGGRIAWNAASGAYEIAAGFEDHPVVGASWYGAAKFCNWLTLDQGMPPSARCYAESTAADLAGWRPVAITTADWSTRDLNAAERAALVAGHAGYRLPMDQGSNNANANSDGPDLYNEWYKAAAWRIASHTVYGFGRSTIAPADANYFGSGHPTPPGTTPVGFYAAGNTMAGGAPVRDTDNAYGLYDMSGNVFQWMQDRHASAGGDRALRGGSWSWPQGAVGTQATKRVSAPPAGTFADTGFRVLRTAPPAVASGDADGDSAVTLFDYAVMNACLGAPSVPAPASCGVFDFDGDGDVDLRDVAEFQRRVGL